MGELFTAHGRLIENFTDIEHNDELELQLTTLVYERVILVSRQSNI